MVAILSLLVLTLQVAATQKTPALSVQLYAQGQHVGAEPAGVVIEITNQSQRPVTLWTSPVGTALKSERRPTSMPVHGEQPVYWLLLVYDRVPWPGQQISEAEGGRLIPFRQVNLGPGETTYTKAVLSPYLVGQRAAIWAEVVADDTVSRSNTMVLEAKSSEP